MAVQVRTVLEARHALMQNAKATYDRVSATVHELLRQGNPNAAPVNYRHSKISDVDDRATVTVGITGLFSVAGAALARAREAAGCGDAYVIDGGAGNYTVTFTVPIVMPIGPPPTEEAAGGALPKQRGWLRRWLEDSYTVGASVRYVLYGLLLLLVVHGLFDRSLSENVDAARRAGRWLGEALLAVAGALSWAYGAAGRAGGQVVQ